MSTVHDVAAVVVRDSAGRILLFDRTRQPLGWTVPAGHIEAGEDARVAAERELWEETGIQVELHPLTPLTELMIEGDLCRRGVSTHRWFVRRIALTFPVSVRLCDEGSEFRWVTPAEAGMLPLTHATRYTLEHLGVL